MCSCRAVRLCRDTVSVSLRQQVQEEQLSAVVDWLTAQPRAAQLVDKDSSVVSTLEYHLGHYLKDVKRHYVKADKRWRKGWRRTEKMNAQFDMQEIEPLVFRSSLTVTAACFLSIIMNFLSASRNNRSNIFFASFLVLRSKKQLLMPLSAGIQSLYSTTSWSRLWMLTGTFNELLFLLWDAPLGPAFRQLFFSGRKALTGRWEHWAEALAQWEEKKHDDRW